MTRHGGQFANPVAGARRRILIAGLVLAVLLLAVLGASISLARSLGSLLRAAHGSLVRRRPRARLEKRTLAGREQPYPRTLASPKEHERV